MSLSFEKFTFIRQLRWVNWLKKQTRRQQENVKIINHSRAEGEVQGCSQKDDHEELLY